jgi:hypothetical protein
VKYAASYAYAFAGDQAAGVVRNIDAAKAMKTGVCQISYTQFLSQGHTDTPIAKAAFMGTFGKTYWDAEAKKELEYEQAYQNKINRRAGYPPYVSYSPDIPDEPSSAAYPPDIPGDLRGVELAALGAELGRLTAQRNTVPLMEAEKYAATYAYGVTKRRMQNGDLQQMAVDGKITSAADYCGE